jgi:hypothetical protein
MDISEFRVPWAARLHELVGRGTLEWLFDQVTIDVPHRRIVDSSRWMGLISSHDSKMGFAHQGWISALMSAIHLAKQQSWVVLCSIDTPYFESIRNACERVEIEWIAISSRPLAAVRSAKTVHSFGDWPHCIGHLSILVDERSASASVPMHDRAVMFLADYLFAVHVRDEGRVASLLKSRLRTEEIPRGTTFVGISEGLSGVKSDQDSGKRWIDQGAIGFITTISPTDPISASLGHCKLQSDRWTHQPIQPVSALLQSNRKYLIHSTRSRQGPWPDQSLSQFHDELLRTPWVAKPSVLDTLVRILTQQRLIGTQHLRRSKRNSVCFTEMPIDEMLTMRNFQSQLGRWNWEPYGLMIDAAFLRSLGAKKVEYVEASETQHLEDDHLLYCQVVSKGNSKHDWTQEREWRLADDLRLNRIPFEKCFVFVKTYDEARAIEPFSRWPVLFCGP